MCHSHAVGGADGPSTVSHRGPQDQSVTSPRTMRSRPDLNRHKHVCFLSLHGRQNAAWCRCGNHVSRDAVSVPAEGRLSSHSIQLHFALLLLTHALYLQPRPQAPACITWVSWSLENKSARLSCQDEWGVTNQLLRAQRAPGRSLWSSIRL